VNARRLSYCRTCGRETPQRFTNRADAAGKAPPVDHYRCVLCGATYLTMSKSVPDAEGLMVAIAEQAIRAKGNRLDDSVKEELIGDLRLDLVEAWVKWDPTTGVPFAAYATAQLRHGVANYFRRTRGRWTPKPLADAVSLNAPAYEHGLAGGREPGDNGDRARTVGEALDEGTVDAGQHSLTDLKWVVERRRGDLAEEERRVGRRSAA
jgi:hypothetical protein